MRHRGESLVGMAYLNQAVIHKDSLCSEREEYVAIRACHWGTYFRLRSQENFPEKSVFLAKI